MELSCRKPDALHRFVSKEESAQMFLAVTCEYGRHENCQHKSNFPKLAHVMSMAFESLASQFQYDASSVSFVAITCSNY